MVTRLFNRAFILHTKFRLGFMRRLALQVVKEERSPATAKEREHSSLSTAGGEATRKPLVSCSRSSIHIVTRTFALLQKLCRGLKRARREKPRRETKYHGGRGGNPHRRRHCRRHCRHRFAELSFRGNCKHMGTTRRNGSRQAEVE